MVLSCVDVVQEEVIRFEKRLKVCVCVRVRVCVGGW